jgi:hypothetical protein
MQAGINIICVRASWCREVGYHGCLVDAERWLVLAVFALTVGGGAWIWPGDAVGGRGA